MAEVDIEEIKCGASSSATTCTASSPRQQVQSELVSLFVDEDVADEEEMLPQEERCVSKREPSERVKLKFLNGLRGLASLLIVHHHAGYLLEVTIAPSSVDIFFVLSAFLLTMINASKIQKLINHKSSFREWVVVLLGYFVKRLLRVYPLFACVAIVLSCMPEATRTHYYNLAHYNNKSWNLCDILPFKKRYYLFWTLPIEITYYFMIPFFLVGFCYLDNAPKAKWSAIGLLYIWVYYEGWHTQRTTHGEFRPHLSTFLAGSLAAAVYLDLSKAMKTRSFKPCNWHIAVVRVFELMMVTILLCRGLFARWFKGSLFPSQHPAVPSVSLPILP